MRQVSAFTLYNEKRSLTISSLFFHRSFACARLRAYERTPTREFVIVIHFAYVAVFAIVPPTASAAPTKPLHTEVAEPCGTS